MASATFPAHCSSSCQRFVLAAVSLVLLFGHRADAQPVAANEVKPAAARGETYPLPEQIKDFAQIMKFVEEIDSQEPTGGSEQEVLTHQRKVARTVVAISEKALAMELKDSDAMQSVFLKLQGLKILGELGEPNADQMLAKAIEAAQADKRPDVQGIGMKFMIESGYGQWSAWGDEEKAALINKITKYVSQREPDGTQIQLVMSVVDFLSQMNSEAYAKQMLSELMPHFQKSENPRIQGVLGMLQGIQRRLNLPGNSIELSGTMLNETQLDWSAYRGKVVLVDFWATWCGPCRAEVPNILKMYKAYHEKGFEVLGISLDTRREQAESYIEQTGIPWLTLFSKNPDERGWQHPMAVKYGITGIPLAILVDRDGKVVHMNARGQNLNTELRRLLGEPVATSQTQGESQLHEVAKPIISNP